MNIVIPPEAVYFLREGARSAGAASPVVVARSLTLGSIIPHGEYHRPSVLLLVMPGCRRVLVTARVTPSRLGVPFELDAMGTTVHRVSSGAVPIVTLAGALMGGSDLDPHEMREFWLIFRRGGMAEWSMAVVLKTEPADLRNSRFSA
jgi:hypothetical protein